MAFLFLCAGETAGRSFVRDSKPVCVDFVSITKQNLHKQGTDPVRIEPLPANLIYKNKQNGYNEQTMDLALVLLLKYKYLILLPITIFEGPSISIVAGAFIATGYLNPFIVYGIVILGDMIGDTFYYCIGRFGGFYSKLRHFFKIDDKRMIIIEEMFMNNGPKILFLGKAQGLGAIVLMAGGLVKYPYKLFMLYNIIATLLKSLILILIGFYFGKEYAVANNYITKIGIFLSFAFLVIAYFYMRKKFKLEK